MKQKQNTLIIAMLQTALEYQNSGKLEQAEKVFHNILRDHPDHVETLHAYASLLSQIGAYTRALELLDKVITSAPKNPVALINKGIILQTIGRHDKSIEALECAHGLQPDAHIIRSRLDIAQEEHRKINSIIENHDNLSETPEIDFASINTNDPQTLLFNINLACALFRRFGVIALKNIISPDYIEELLKTYRTRYRKFFTTGSFDNTLQVGKKRTMITVEASGPFNEPQLYANRFLLPIMQRLLGEDCILGGLGSVISLPGAPKQHLHRDYKHLYQDEAPDDIITHLPAFAITAVIPLVPLTKEIGTTRVYPGTHSLGPDRDKITSATYTDPYINTGSCLMWDYRLLHQGLPNTTNEIRPILYNVYYRDWFRDPSNYRNQDSISISQDEFAKVPEKYKHLFRWALRSV